MGAAQFYHLTRDGIGETVRMLLPKALAAGLVVDIRAPSAELLDRLDQQLWLGPEDGFLPHGRAGGPHDALQPALLTEAETLRPETTCLMCLAGAPVDPGEVARLAKTCILFDGGDAAALEHARGKWKLLTEAGCPAQYWSQETGAWTKKAEAGAAPDGGSASGPA